VTILVTGANGALGRAFIPFLEAHYDEQVIGSVRSGGDNLKFINCDVSIKSDVHHLIKLVRPRLVFHLAASFANNFEDDIKVNALASQYIFDALLQEELSSRVVIFGSAAEYGAVLPADNPISELYPCSPVSVYGLTKSFQTQMAMFYARTKNIDVVVARLFNLATSGLSQRLFYGKAEAMILAYNKGEVSHIEFGNLNSERDYIELDNVVTQILAIADFGVSGEIYNVGSGVPIEIRTILKAMLESAGVPWDCVIESDSEAVGRKGYDVPLIYADVKKITELLKVP